MTHCDTLFKLGFDVLVDVKPSKIESYIDEAFGLEEQDYIDLIKYGYSLQSWRIQMGNQLEIFMNKVFSYLNVNEIEDEVLLVGKYKRGPKKGQDKIKVVKRNKVKVGKEWRQVDHYIRIKRKDGVWFLYLESKCNLKFDTEKKGESNDKVLEVMKSLGANEGVYYVPVLKRIPNEITEQYSDVKILGIQDVLDLIPDCPFTADMFFELYSQVKTAWFAKLRAGEV